LLCFVVVVLMVLVVGSLSFGWIRFWPNNRSFFVVVTALLPSWWLEVLTWRWVIDVELR
jgi:hypothetical protein